MLGREIVKGKQHLFIFGQAFAGFWKFDLVTGEELIVGRQSGFASRRQVHFMDQLLRFALNTLVPRCLVWVIAKLTHVWDIQIELTGSMVGCGSKVDEVSKSPSHSFCELDGPIDGLDGSGGQLCIEVGQDPIP
jgi:hypothetical protein